MTKHSLLSTALMILLIFPLTTACGAAETQSLPPLVINRDILFPLSEPGPYSVGIQNMISFTDASRNDREVNLTIWYPAAEPQDFSKTGPFKDAPADLMGAPYPLILSSSKTGFIFAKTLASYGFVVAGVNRIDAYLPWDQNLVDQPLDILFALDQVRDNPPEGLEKLIDFKRVGAMGYSFDGYNALALSGARVDPEYFLSDCSAPPADEPALLAWTRPYQCELADTWDAFTENAGPGLTESEDGLWQPMTDPGILAVMPMATEGLRLFGDRGLAAADRAVLMIASENDELNPEDQLIYESLGVSDKSLITFLNQNHMMIFNPEMTTCMTHFAVAFFGYQLQGRTELEYYYSPNYVNQQPGLVWGPFPAE